MRLINGEYRLHFHPWQKLTDSSTILKLLRSDNFWRLIFHFLRTWKNLVLVQTTFWEVLWFFLDFGMYIYIRIYSCGTSLIPWRNKRYSRKSRYTRVFRHKNKFFSPQNFRITLSILRVVKFLSTLLGNEKKLILQSSYFFYAVLLKIEKKARKKCNFTCFL